MIAAAPGATAHDLIASELHTNCLVDAINEAWREKARGAPLVSRAFKPAFVCFRQTDAQLLDFAPRSDARAPPCRSSTTRCAR